jgi:N-methylhydantoinase A
VLVGEGGGAAALIPFVAERMKLDFSISQDAEVISSIGVALALMRETVERVIPNAMPDDLQRIKREAFDAVVRLGAAPENVEVTIEVDPQTQRVRATAMGASEMRVQDMRKEVSEDEAREIAARSMGLSPETLRLAAATDQVRVFQGQVEERKWRIFSWRRAPLRAVDREGVIRIQRSDGVVAGATARTGLAEMRRLWEEVTIYNGDSVITPDMFVIAGRRVVDLSGVSALEQALAIGRSELEGLAPEAPVALITVQGARGI